MCRFIGKTNAILCDFGCCDSSTLVNIHGTFCLDLYGCELWNISSKYTEEMHTAWRIAMRKIWKLHPRTHNNLICNIRSNFTHKNTYFQCNIRDGLSFRDGLNYSNIICILNALRLQQLYLYICKYI